jgi:hypothetical protein
MARKVMITKAERRWAFYFGIAVMIFTTLPYLLRFAAQTAGWRYTGLLYGSEDGFSYLAKMQLGAAGDWLFRTPYTAYPQSGYLGFFPYILLGKLAEGLGQYDQMAALFHLFRILGGILAVLATYDFCSLFIASIPWRRFTTVLAVFGGGLGFLEIFGLGSLWHGVMGMPLEFYSPETFGYLSYLLLPHLVWARALMLWGLVALLKSQQGMEWRTGIRSGLLWLLMGFFQPLTVVSVWMLLAFWLAWRWLTGTIGKNMIWSAWISALKTVIWAGLVSAPIVLYNLIVFQLDPFLKRWQAQNLIPSPPPGDYLLAFGILLPLALLGIWAMRKSSGALAMPLAWCLAFPFMAYFPYNLQRRLPEGFWIALCILAILGIQGIAARWKKLAVAWACLAFLTTVFFMVDGLRPPANPGLPLYRPIVEVRAMQALAKEAHAKDVVLAAYDTSTVLPTRAPVRVLIGHGPESLDGKNLAQRVEMFYQPATPDADRIGLIREFNIRYIFRGPFERTLGAWDPSAAAYTKKIYDQDDYQIYEVLTAP